MKIPFIHRYKAAHPRHPDNLPPGTGRGPTMRLGKSAIVLGPRPRLPDATPVQLGNPAPRTASIDELLDARKEARTAELKAFAYQATDELLGPNQRDRLSELKARNGELVELLRQYVASGNAEEALQLGGRLAQSWWMNGLQEQMRPLMADVMPLLHQGSDDARARAMAGMGSLEYALSDFDRARELYGDAVPLLEGDALLQAHVLDRAGMASRQQGAFDEAAGFHGRAADLLRQLPGTEAQLALCLNNLGVVELHRDGDFDAAHAHHSEALALRRTSGDVRGTASSLNNLAQVDRFRGNFDAAISVMEEARRLRESIVDAWGVAGSHMNLAAVKASLATQLLAGDASSEQAADLIDAAGDHAEAVELLACAQNRRNQYRVPGIPCWSAP